MSSLLPSTASPASSVRSPSPNPPLLRGARSFSRLEPADTGSDPLSSSLSRLTRETPLADDDLAAPPAPDSSEDEDGNPLSAALLPEGFDSLPPELITLADRFIDSLTKPIHPAPLNITQLSDMFQQFYGTAQQAIQKHVSHSYLSLSSKRNRPGTPTTQMLSKAEIAQKKRDRKLLEVKRIALEEAVEKRVAEGVYDKIWRHKSTDDEARDDSLHSKIAALKVVGVNLGHLGVELESPEKVKLVDHELQGALRALAGMNDKKFPLGKLSLLKQAHKTIVDCLTNHISHTSADSLLPTLIYTLILSPPEPHLNAISNLYFTQRFRANNFIDGEAAYCLTNFEAAISFLETVDLASLNIDNTPVLSTSSSSTTSLLKPVPAHTTTTTTATTANALPVPHPTRPRGISYLTPIDLATSAVETADQGIRGIGVALENSYKFLFDRRGDIAPRTLEDARKLVDAPSNPAITLLQRSDSDIGEEKPRSMSMREPSPQPPVSPSPVLKHIGTSIGRFANIGMRGLARVAPREEPPAGGVERLEYKVVARFAELEDARELKIGEVERLLREYGTLVAELRKRGLVA